MADVLILIPARMAATRLPGKPLADIAGLPMIVHVLRRAEAAAVGPVVVATDSPQIAAGCGKGWRPRGHDRRRPRFGLRPHLRGARQDRSGRRGGDRGQCARRSADAGARHHYRRGRLAGGSIGRHRNAGGRDHAGRRARRPRRGQSRGHAGRAGTAARALFHPGHRPLRRRAALSSHRPLRLPPRGARTLRDIAAVAAGETGKARAIAGASKPACASTSRSWTQLPLGVDTPEDLARARVVLSGRS